MKIMGQYYGTVPNVFVAKRLLKLGKYFAFVRFSKLVNIESLVSNLCTIWIGKLKLVANVAHFQRA